jgi:hypothetical protein
VDGTGSGSCPVVGFVLAVLNFRVLLPESQLISKMDLREIGCEDGTWMELAQDRVQLRGLVLAVLNLQVLLPQSQYTEEYKDK